jgi:FkbM family methyltransferase
MLSRLRPFVERFPVLAITYRTLRDTWTLQRQRPRSTPYGFTLRGQSGMQAGEFEPEEVALLQHDLLGDADVFVDVGANVGLYACLARSSGKHTIAVEPLGHNLNSLYANIVENGWDDVEVYPVALGRRPGITGLFGSNTGASMIEGWAGASPLLRHTVAVSTLDILLGARFSGKRLVVKIDVEGAEYDVLEGASGTLAMVPRPIWLVEIGLTQHYPTGFNANYARTFDVFWRNGYEARTADRAKRLILPADVERWVGKKASDFGGINYLFVPKTDRIRGRGPSERI